MSLSQDSHASRHSPPLHRFHAIHLLSALFLFVGHGEATLPGGRAGHGVEIIEQRHDRLRLSYSSAAAVDRWISTAGESATAPDGLLRLSHQTVVVGIPLHGEVQLEVVEVTSSGLFAAPVLDDQEWDLPLDGPVIQGEPGFLRDQRVVQISFAPKLAEGATEVELFSRVIVDVHFTGGGSSRTRQASHHSRRWENQLYKRSIINHEQAAGWRRSEPAAKTTLQEAAGRDHIRMTVRRPGIHRVTGQDLAAAGVPLSAVVPGAIRMFYAGGLTLGRSSTPSAGVERKEIPILVEDGDDGRFDQDDEVLFYGEPVERWDYNRSLGYFWRQNVYTKDNVFFLEWEGEGEGLRAERLSGALVEAKPRRSNRYRERLREEDEKEIFTQLEGIKSGYDWFWETFRGNARNYGHILWDVSPDEQVDVKLRFWGLNEGTHGFEARWNDSVIGMLNFTGKQAETLRVSSPTGAVEGLNQLGVFHQDNTPTRFDWYEIEYGRALHARGGELVFDWLGAADTNPSAVSLQGGNTAEFHLTGFDDGRPRIFDVKSVGELNEIVDFEYDSTSGSVTFQGFFSGVGKPPYYLVADEARWQRPLSFERKTPAGLKTPDNGAEYVIITHGDFRDAAERLAAWRAVDDRFGPPLSTKVVDVEDVYDDFSGGLLDPMAIRSFVTYAVGNWDPAPVFIVLMGDGTYDYKNNLGISHTNWIPPYQDGSSMYDEWYVRTDGIDRLPDLAIGRLPVRSASNADALVDKLIAYDRDPEIGLWQARMLLVADDKTNPATNNNESFFVFDAEHLAEFLVPKEFDLRKLYIGSYPLEGRTKPAARDDFVARFNEGALILTYIGHGNPATLAHEQMFVLTRDIDGINNGRRLPFVYTAASQVGVFDDPLRESMPEVFLSDPDGGVIGFISATRVGYHASNMVLAREFHEIMYTSEDTAVPVGLALTAAKRRISVSNFDRVNVQRYSLLGDPAQILHRPRLNVQIQAPDSLKAFQEVLVEGQVLDPSGNPVVDFDGQAIVQAFDSDVRSLVEGIPWEQPGAPIFRSFADVKDGAFEAVFRVPKDISYRESEGRISAYVMGDGVTTAHGSVRGIAFGGTQDDVEPDIEGPVVTLAFEGQSEFRDGDFIPNQPLLKAPIEDAGGVNITGETGHEIELRIDDELFKVTDFYTSLNGDYRTGVIEYEMPELEPGSHDISLKVWDNFNNSSRAQTTVQVAETDGSPLSSVIFHPNPMHDHGYFTYILTTPARTVRIKVFTLSGRLVDDIEGDGHPGYNQVAWEPPAALANGAYLYRLEVVAQQGLAFEATSVIQVTR
jgi:hypothetical protein